MAFYIRKSLRFGPLRFNLSKSGVGVSAGVKGFRLGSGPRGNYVHMGRGGLYYRASLSSPARSSHGGSPASLPAPRGVEPPTLSPAGDVAMREIDSDSAARIVDSSSQTLVQELREKHKKIRLSRVGLVVGFLFTVFGLAAPREGFGLPLFLLSVGLYVVLRVYDARRKTTVIFYDLADESADLFRGLHEAFTYLEKAKKLWHIPSEGKVRDAKYHAGANTLVTRNVISVGFGNPPFVKTNIPTPSLRVGAQTLYFFPDRILIFDAKDIGGLAYDSLSIDVATTHFIEQQGVPRDARTVGQTWRYVNKKGGPDRRFANNPTIPIAEYEDVRLTSRSGLNEALQVSRVGSFAKIGEAVRRIDNYLRAESVGTSTATPPALPGSVQDASEPTQGKSATDWFPFIAAGIAGACVVLLLIANASPKAPAPTASVTVSSPASKEALPVAAAPIVSMPPVEKPSVPPTATPPPQPAVRIEPAKPVERFSETTPLPATLILGDALMLMSKEHGVVGLGKGGQVTVTTRSGQQLTVVSDGNAFSVDVSELAGAIVAPGTTTPAP
ncbi:MAG: DUF4236 domain-containing protein [Verrucomicrobiota bacterium]